MEMLWKAKEDVFTLKDIRASCCKEIEHNKQRNDEYGNTVYIWKILWECHLLKIRLHIGKDVSSVFCSTLGQPLIIPSRKLLTISLYTHFENLQQSFNHKKSIIGINTYKLTLNKNFFIRINTYK